MKNSPKSIVLARHKSAFCAHISGGRFYIDTPTRQRNAENFLGSGKTPSGAWRNAARHIKTAPLENRRALLMAQSRVAAATAQAHWFNSIHGGLSKSRCDEGKRLYEQFHAEAVRLDTKARRLRK